MWTDPIDPKKTYSAWTAPNCSRCGVKLGLTAHFTAQVDDYGWANIERVCDACEIASERFWG